MASFSHGFIFSILSRKIAAACAWSSVKFSKCRNSRSVGRIFSEIIQNFINLIKGLIEDSLKLFSHGFRILNFSIILGWRTIFESTSSKTEDFTNIEKSWIFFSIIQKLILLKMGPKCLCIPLIVFMPTFVKKMYEKSGIYELMMFLASQKSGTFGRIFRFWPFSVCQTEKF